MSRWNGTHLRLMCPLAFPPFLSLFNDSEGRIRISGLTGSLLSNLTHAMGMTYEVTPAPNGVYGIPGPDPDKFTGMLRSLHRNEADMILPGFFADVNLFNHFRFVPFTLETSTVIWTGMKNAFETSPTPYVKAFDSETWAMLFFSMLVLAMFHTLEGVVLRQQRFKIREITENFLGVLQSLLQEASKNRYSGADRVLGGAWMLASFVLMLYFTGDLKANSVMQTPTTRITTADDMYEHRKTHRLIYPLETSVEDDWRGMKAKKMKIMVDEGFPLKVYQYFAPRNLKILLEGRGIFSGEEYCTTLMISQFCGTTDRFFYKSTHIFPRTYFAMVMANHLNKNLTDEISRRMSIIFSMGVPFVPSRALTPGGVNCIVTEQSSQIAFDALRFTDLSFTFLSHLAFLSCCTAIFVAEILFSLHSRAKFDS